MNDNKIDEFRKILKENIFSCMEMSKQPYYMIMQMPIQRLYDYLIWKDKLEEEKRKRLEERGVR